MMNQRQICLALWDEAVLELRGRNELLTAKRLSDQGKRGMWRRWERERAILDTMPTVERIAKEVRWMFARHLDLRDLMQAGAVGLVKAANAYHPARGAFAPYAWFYVRGSIIDSQKRRTYREEGHTSLQAIAAAHDGWLPPEFDTDGAPLPDALAERAEIRARLASCIEALPEIERAVLRGHLAGQTLAVTAKQAGLSLTWTREKLAGAREMVAVAVRGE